MRRGVVQLSHQRICPCEKRGWFPSFELGMIHVPYTNLTTATRARTSSSGATYTTKSLEDGFAENTMFQSFHHQVKMPISDRALMVGFQMLWRKRSMVPTSPHNALSLELVYLVMQIVYGDRLFLLPATMENIQGRLRRTTEYLHTH